MTPAELLELASKYDALAELRRLKTRGAPEPARSEWRAIAKAHPGALKELELLELTEIDGRRSALRSAADGTAAVEPWMRWIATYHALLREAQLQRGAHGARAIDPGVAEDLARAASARARIPIAGSLLMRLAKPPGGRVLPVVVAAIAATHGAAEDDVARMVGMRRRSAAQTGEP